MKISRFSRLFFVTIAILLGGGATVALLNRSPILTKIKSSLVQNKSSRGSEGESIPAYGDPENSVLVTFEVKVPKQTPTQDKIYLIIDKYMPKLDSGISRGIPMVKTGPDVWSVIFKSSRQNAIKYKYNRDNIGYETDEEFFPDNPNTWREIFVRDKNLSVRDEVQKWRWLFLQPPRVNLSTFTPPNAPQKDKSFVMGVSLLDFFDPKFKELIPTTMDRIKAKGFEYVGITAPASTFISSDPLKFTREYTDYELLEYMVGQARKSGLKVMLSAGIETATTATKSFEEIEAEFQKPQEDKWYRQLAKEWKDSMTVIAKFAQKNGVEIFTPSDQWFVWGKKTKKQKKMLNHLINDAYTEIKKIYSGKLSSDNYNPDEAYDYYKQLDWIGDKWWWSLTSKKDATLGELKEGAERIVRENYQPLYKKYKKPIFIQQLAYASYDGAASTLQISTEDSRVASWYPYNDEISLDLQEQADAYEAVFRAIWDESIFAGAISFGYAYWNSHDKSSGIRGKPAENVWVKWNNLLAHPV